MLPDDRGTAAYNLGCFYALLGRAVDAGPLLRAAFWLEPELREWARQDSALDSIRGSPALVDLLGQAGPAPRKSRIRGTTNSL